MPNCAIATCRNTNRTTKGKDVKFFRFPKNQDMAVLWFNACRRNKLIDFRYARICSDHFDMNAYEIPLKHQLLKYSPKNCRYLKRDAVPNINLPPTEAIEKHYVSMSETKGTECGNLETVNQNKIDIEPTAIDPLAPSIKFEVGEEVELQGIKTEEIDRLSEIKVLKAKNHVLETENEQLGSAYKRLEIKELEKTSQIKQMEEKIQKLENEFKKNQLALTVTDYKLNQYQERLKKIFTTGQIKKLLNGDDKKMAKWAAEDIEAAINLWKNTNSSSYRYLVENGFPLPALSTLRKWARTFGFELGLIELEDKK